MNINPVSVIVSISNSNPVSTEKESCAICLLDLEKEDHDICGHPHIGIEPQSINDIIHPFHQHCIRGWMVRPQSNQRCPLCKHKIEKWYVRRSTLIEITFRAPNGAYQIHNLGYLFFNSFEVRHHILGPVIFYFLATLTVAFALVWFASVIATIAQFALLLGMITEAWKVCLTIFVIGNWLLIPRSFLVARESVRLILAEIAPPLESETWIEEE
jgi:hypothetical protein